MATVPGSQKWYFQIASSSYCKSNCFTGIFHWQFDSFLNERIYEFTVGISKPHDNFLFITQDSPVQGKTATVGSRKHLSASRLGNCHEIQVNNWMEMTNNCKKSQLFFEIVVPI